MPVLAASTPVAPPEPGGAARWAAAALVVAGLLLLRRVGHRLVLRARLRRAARAGGSQAGLDAAVRTAVPLLRRTRPRHRDVPRDPCALTVPVVLPSADGRPGVRFGLPSVPVGPGAAPPRIDVRCRLERGGYLIVVCLGRVGTELDGAPIESAERRCATTRSRLTPGWAPDGPVLELATPAGPAWRHTFETTRARVVDTHVDRDGWAFVVGVLQDRSRPRLDGVADVVLASWRWGP